MGNSPFVNVWMRDGAAGKLDTEHTVFLGDIREIYSHNSHICTELMPAPKALYLRCSTMQTEPKHWSCKQGAGVEFPNFLIPKSTLWISAFQSLLLQVSEKILTAWYWSFLKQQGKKKTKQNRKLGCLLCVVIYTRKKEHKFPSDLNITACSSIRACFFDSIMNQFRTPSSCVGANPENCPTARLIVKPNIYPWGRKHNTAEF